MKLRNTACLFLAILLIGGIGITNCQAQEEVTIPALKIARRPIPDNDAMSFMKKMGVGWNLGNTFDAIKGDWNANADEMTVETSWCGVKTTAEIFDALREAGYSTVRIPVSWHDHVSGDDYRISERWLARVQQVVDWAMERGFYVILNIHHDEDQFSPAEAHYEQSAQYVSCIWQQLAERFRDYDEHLIFESMNEPRLVGSSNEWYFNKAARECVKAAECLNKLNQLFVDTVRATGGNNVDRYLMLPGYDASPDGALNQYYALPEDTADNRLIVSVHAYTPYAFALQEGGKKQFSHQHPSDTQDIVSFMNLLYSRYITNGIPVVIGEFGARNKNGNLQDRVNYTAFYTATASARNIPCILWDNHAFQGNGELFGVLDRRKAEFAYPQIAEAMTLYGGYDKLPDPQ